MAILLKHTLLLLTAAQALLMVGITHSFAEEERQPMLMHAKRSEIFEEYKLYVEGSDSFKAIAFSQHGAVAWTTRSNLKTLIADVLTLCANHITTGECRVFAVGNTIVWDMTPDEQARVIAEYKATRSPSAVETTASMHHEALKAFNNYTIMADFAKFKIFMLSEDGAWSYLSRPEYTEAFSDAMNLCEESAGRHGLCYVFAVGDTVVWDMSEEEKNAVIEAYRTKNEN